MRNRIRSVIFAGLLGLVLIGTVLVLAGCRQPVERVQTQGVSPVRFTFQDSAVTTATGSVLDVTQLEKVTVQVEGITDATVTFQGTIDGSTWYGIEAVNRNTGAKATSTTADGMFDIVLGFAQLRANLSTYVSGTIIVTTIDKRGGVASPADVIVSEIVPGTGATNLGKEEDAVHASGDVGVEMLAVRNDDLGAVLAGADGDYAPLAVCEHGGVYVTGSAVGQTAVDYEHGLVGIGGIVMDARPATDIIAGNAEWGVFQMTQYGEIRIRDDDANTDLDTLIVDTASISAALNSAISGGQVQVDIVADGASLATSAGQLADGHNVTVDNATGAAAVNIQDGGNTITVDGTVTAGTELPAAAALADAAANPTVPTAGAAQMLYNSKSVAPTWDRERNNWSEWPFPSLQRTASGSVTVENYNAKGAYIVVNITGIGVDQSLTVSASLYDYDGAGTEASDQQEVLWASAALTPTGRHTYLVYPGAGAAAQDVIATVSYPLPRLFRIGTVLNNSEPITFSIGVHYIN